MTNNCEERDSLLGARRCAIEKRACRAADQNSDDIAEAYLHPLRLRARKTSPGTGLLDSRQPFDCPRHAMSLRPSGANRSWEAPFTKEPLHGETLRMPHQC